MLQPDLERNVATFYVIVHNTTSNVAVVFIRHTFNDGARGGDRDHDDAHDGDDVHDGGGGHGGGRGDGHDDDHDHDRGDGHDVHDGGDHGAHDGRDDAHGGDEASRKRTPEQQPR
ncbi:hypothetical protein AVEN_175524-1 [Araneus ventricosus]|uniref:Uncharacterized protein n=1 Tax=Araneus ventricosus TaxID=182803 RepID=A0A4Y2CQS9_ARAVE|nr:hypothetical protein AVEN_175524-1 [Araneus ventricosus]